jgi:YidC/Oxa1 family membrane protein insertase
MNLYLGPKDYKIMRRYKQDLEEQISLGWWLFRYVNTLVIINLFQWLDGFNLSYGLIILILTIIVKLALSPITYKTYLSSAKMRVLKPDIDALNEKNKDADPLKKQQEVMNLYRRAGVNPLSGCIPALLQMPILFAIFQFFPSSIELRGQGFLWADDLSSWDSIASLPFTIPFYGNHVSLFTLLMTATTMIYTMLSQTNMGDSAQAKQMKILMYVMPIMFLGVLNSYSSALSYYYFLANTVSIAQTLVIRYFIVDENKLRAQIDENKKKPVKGKSRWAAKLEEMQKLQQQRTQELDKKRKK